MFEFIMHEQPLQPKSGPSPNVLITLKYTDHCSFKVFQYVITYSI